MQAFLAQAAPEGPLRGAYAPVCNLAAGHHAHEPVWIEAQLADLAQGPLRSCPDKRPMLSSASGRGEVISSMDDAFPGA